MAGQGVGDLDHRGAAEVRAPGVTLPIGLGIGRLVFRALNICEFALAAAVVAAFAFEPPTIAIGIRRRRSSVAGTLGVLLLST